MDVSVMGSYISDKTNEVEVAQDDISFDEKGHLTRRQLLDIIDFSRSSDS